MPVPIQDDIFDRLRFYRAINSSPIGFLEYLIAPHNEHRIATTRIIAGLDEVLFRGCEYTQLIFINLMQICGCGLAYVFLLRSRMGQEWHPTQRAFALAGLILMFINPDFFYTLIIAFQIQHSIMELIVIAAAVLVARASEDMPSTHEQCRVVFGLLALAIVGTFTLGNSPCILLAAASTAMLLRWPLRITLILVALAVLHTGIIFATTQTVGTRSSNLAMIAKFGLLYWGSPFLRLEPWPAVQITWWSPVLLAAAFGAAVFLTPIIFGGIRYFVKPGVGGRVAIFGFVILLAIIATGIAAGLDRSQFGVLEGASKKYSSFAALGWVGVTTVWAGVAKDWLRRPRHSEMIVFGCMFLILFPLSVIGYTRETRIWQKMVDVTWEQSLAVFLQVNERDVLNSIYNNDLGLDEYVHDIQPHKRSIFSYFRFRWGDDVKAILAKSTETACRSEVETVTPVPHNEIAHIFNNAGLPYTISGWAWMITLESPPATVIAVNQVDRVVGVALFTRTSGRAEEWLGQKFYQNLGWFGFARLPHPESLSFYALSDDNRHYCVLGGLGDVH